MSTKATMWERTSVQSLLRNRSSERYYGRWKIAGKQKWVALDTDVFTVAKLRLNKEAAEIEKLRSSKSIVSTGAGSMADLMRIYEDRVNSLSELRPSSISARLVALKKVQKTWPALAGLNPSQVSYAAVEQWVTRLKAEGTRFTPPGAKTVVKGNSATSVNRAIDTLRRLMDIAVERGAIHQNPVVLKPTEARLKKKVTRKVLTLPSSADLQRLYVAMETNGARGGWGQEAADLCRFLSFSGARIGEVATVTWASVDFEKRQIHIAGYKSQTSDRIVPLFAGLEELLKRIIERRKKAALVSVDRKPYLDKNDPVFRISECQKTIDKACEKTGITRVTHHDFRHLFATRCIESGVDIPTVSRWLGHSDGGALAMKTYGHLRQEHSQAQAAKVIF